MNELVTRALQAAAALVVAGIAASAQGLAPAPSAVQHVAVRPGASAPAVSPGGTLSLWVDVTPNANIHVYAPGAKDFQPVKLVLSPMAGVEIGKTVYPAGILTVLPGTAERIPVYSKVFRITQPMTFGKTPPAGKALIVSGAVNYQACDDRVCFPPASQPVFWRIEVK
jgi:hypothetical protein